MPRLSTSLLKRARKISTYLPLVLRSIRTLQSAISELRWLTEHVMRTTKPKESTRQSKSRLLKLVRRRARGEPLQYILGTQPFGELNMRCKPGVLIPRRETESYVVHITDLLKAGKLHDWFEDRFSDQHGARARHKRKAALRILDACSGSGCISLLALKRLKDEYPYLTVIGMDSSKKAVDLAVENHKRNKRRIGEHQGQLRFLKQDLFDELPPSMYDIIICNPPYVSHREFVTEVDRSVRNWEPRDALVPRVPSHFVPGNASPQDIFYERMLEIHDQTYNKFLLMEVGSATQAIRVLQRAMTMRNILERNSFEIWRDEPSQPPEEGVTDHIILDKFNIPITGAGKIRSIIVRRIKHFAPEHKKDYSIYHVKLRKPASMLPKRLTDREKLKRDNPKELRRREERSLIDRARLQKTIIDKPLRSVDPDLEQMLKPMTSGWRISGRRRPPKQEWKIDLEQFPEYVPRRDKLPRRKPGRTANSYMSSASLIARGVKRANDRKKFSEMWGVS